MDRADDSSPFLRAFTLHLRARRLRPHTIEGYLRDVRRLLVGRHPGSVTGREALLYFEEFSRVRAAKTVRDAQLAVRAFYRFLDREGEVEGHPLTGLRLTPYTTLPQPAYGVEDVRRMLEVLTGRGREEARAQALVLTFWDTGVRVSELVAMEEVEWDTGRIAIRSGKTPAAARTVRVGLRTLAAIDRYVRRWPVRKPPLWWGRWGPLTVSGAAAITRRVCAKAGVEYRGTHAFRRGAAAEMKRRGMQDSDLLEFFGWTDVTMLRRYTHTLAGDLALRAHERYGPGDAL